MALMHHLAENGSDGFVVAGTTGEASTLTDEEQLGLIELAVAERPPGKTIIAGTGTNDTRQAVHLTERATELGADAMLSVTPYYNRPSRLGLHAPLRSGRRAPPTNRSLLYNIPARTGTNMPPDLLAELAQIDGHRGRQAGQRGRAAADRRPRRCTPATTARFARTLDIGGAGGILVASHIVGNEMRRMVDEPEHRAEIDASLRDVYETLFLTSNPTCTKAALNMLGHDVGGLRLPLVEATEEEAAAVRAMLERHGLLRPPAQPRVSSALRVLPLGGLGEIGKNMTVVEYDDRIVVVDVGLRFPTPEMVGIDLVLPDFAYLRERAKDIEAIVVTHGHEDHLGALPWVLRELGEDATRRPSTAAR